MTSKRISVLFLICIAVLFVLLAGAGFVADTIKQKAQQAATTALSTVTPTEAPEAPRFFLKSARDRVVYEAGEEISLIVYGDSYNTPVEGFDLVFNSDFGKRAQDVVVKSLHPGFDVSDSIKDGIVSITGLKKFEEKEPIVFADTALAELTFTVDSGGLLPIAFAFVLGNTTDSNMVDSTASDILKATKGLDLYIGKKLTLTTGLPVELDAIVSATLVKIVLADAACRDCGDTVVVKIARGIEQKELSFVSGGIAGRVPEPMEALGYLFEVQNMSENEVALVAAPAK